MYSSFFLPKKEFKKKVFKKKRIRDDDTLLCCSLSSIKLFSVLSPLYGGRPRKVGVVVVVVVVSLCCCSRRSSSVCRRKKSALCVVAKKKKRLHNNTQRCRRLRRSRLWSRSLDTPGKCCASGARLTRLKRRRRR